MQANDIGPPENTSGLVADLDGDGRFEVILRNESGNSSVLTYDPATRALIPFAGTRSWAPPRLPIAALDIDGDGRTDVLTSSEEGHAIHWAGEAPDHPNVIDVKHGSGATGQDVEFDDFDEDGLLDILVSDASCCDTCMGLRLLLQDGPRHFVERSDLFTVTARSTFFVLMSTRMVGDDRILVAIGGACGMELPTGFYHRVRITDEGLPVYESFNPLPEHPYFAQSSPTLSSQAHPSISQSSPMGGSVGDLDGDGVLDLALSLASHSFFGGRTSYPLLDQTTRASLAQEFAGRESTDRTPWGSALIDLDQDGRTDFVVAHGHDGGAWFDKARRGITSNPTAHWNSGDFCFADVTDAVGALGAQGNWVAVSLGDLDRDGDADLLIGGEGQRVHVFRNDIDVGNHGLTLLLKGTSSNVLGVGAVVDVLPEAGANEQRFVVGGHGSPMAFSRPLVYAGLGRAKSAERVRIVWPSGVVQELNGLTAGTLHEVTEPPLFVISPAGRHVTVAGSATLTIVPRQPDGSARAAPVEVAVKYGAPATITLAPAGPTGWTATVTGPSVAGSTVLEIKVDGVATPLRPRIFWDAK